MTIANEVYERTGLFNYVPYDMTLQKRFEMLGFSTRAGVRKYFDSGDEEIEGPYMELEGMFRRYNSTILSNTTILSAREHNDHKEARLLFGWQDSGWSDFFLWDFSAGFGYRSHSRHYVGWTDSSHSSEKMMNGHPQLFCIPDQSARWVPVELNKLFFRNSFLPVHPAFPIRVSGAFSLKHVPNSLIFREIPGERIIYPVFDTAANFR